MNKALGRLSVLIVDDDTDMCWALQRFVKSEGIQSVVVNNARDALKALATNIFGLAFVDVKLPDMDGLELVHQIHNLAPMLPCVLVSGYLFDDDDQVQNCLKTGLICKFIPKPFQLDQIRDTLRHFQLND